ncbi:MAG: alpha/beta fold hydrolase [Deltaproteobacteria bacterium]|nr:alpha/beta fold hydrolase [Deltaproteobacteria bacterium]
MEKWFGDIVADVFSPEKSKFKSPLILLHGLWTGNWCWDLWGTHFSNLGWECWAMNLRGRFGERAREALKELSFDHCVEDLRRIIRVPEIPPVLLAHDIGGLIAQKAVEEEKVSALILLSPFVPRDIPVIPPRPLRLFRLKYWPLFFFRRPFRPEPRDFNQTWLASLPEVERPRIFQRVVPESSQLISELFQRRVGIDRAGILSPILIVAGTEDRVIPPGALRQLALRLGAEFKEFSNHGHWMMEEPDGEKIVAEVHRWVMQTLGEEILEAEST